MIIHLLIGALAMGAFWFISSYVQKNELTLDLVAMAADWLANSIQCLCS